MGCEVIFVIELDCPDNTEPIGQDACFVSIAKMPVKLLLLDLIIGGGMGRHGTISSFIGVIGI